MSVTTAAKTSIGQETTNQTMNDCDNTTDCTKNTSLSHSIRMAIGTVGITSCCLSIIGCIFAVAVIVIYKKYVFSVQRLILYFTISVFINVLGQILDRATFLYEVDDNMSTTICKVAALTSQYTALAIVGSVCCIMFELLIGVFKYTESGMRLNIIYVIVIFVLPITVSWIPFVNNSYGRTEWTCDIVIVNECCKMNTAGLIMTLLLWWIPLYATLFYLVIGYAIITIKLLYDRRCYTAMIELNRNQVYQNTYNDITYLKYYPILIMLINILPIVSSTYDIVYPNNPCRGLWIPAAFVKGIQGGFIATIAVLDSKTRKRLTFKELKTAFAYNILMKQVAEEYPVINSSISDSLHPNNSHYGTNQ